MNPTDIIAKKRDRRQLTADEITSMIAGFVRGEVSEGQMAALLMAVVLNGMTAAETFALTSAMVATGDRLDLSALPGLKVDKHSTGGVGDKTTLVVAPLVAALGVPVAKMSGRALGHTGGTIDKLEALPGLTTQLSPERFLAQLGSIGLVIAAQSKQLAPADGLLYALRDATATVESLPLIASSVMSKKLAAGADAIVLDVKFGQAAFLPEEERARELAQLMVEMGARQGRRMVALVTRMDQPLGNAVGEAVELAEAVATLSGRGPSDLVELCEALAAQMLVLGGAVSGREEGIAQARQGLASGIGLAKLREMVIAQGGSPEGIEDPQILLQGTEARPIFAEGKGFITALDARRIGHLLRELKTATGEQGRQWGLLLHQKLGDQVTGDPVATLLAPAQGRRIAANFAAKMSRTYRLGNRAPTLPELVVATITPQASS